MANEYNANRCLLDDSLLESQVSPVTNARKPYLSVSQEAVEKPENGDKVPLQAAVITIKGMTCHSCVNNIQDTMRSRPGIHSCKVSLYNAEGIFTFFPLQSFIFLVLSLGIVVFDPSIWSGASVAESIDDMGFEAKLEHSYNGLLLFSSISRDEAAELSNTYRRKTTVSIKGMVCKACVNNIQDTTMKRPGVFSVVVSLEMEEGTLSGNNSVNFL
ncbi:unnamed protein product [Angiostrongylus costaricensis]|uniref:HMA domain-containing protein n=1 Tax=Angiostrongylus costaricensis TaxID=334426 RepID=A0A0R3PTS1_ANGCS|nr:unnamed protein product [Angiostrongylus costaricensis]